MHTHTHARACACTYTHLFYYSFKIATEKLRIEYMGQIIYLLGYIGQNGQKFKNSESERLHLGTNQTY